MTKSDKNSGKPWAPVDVEKLMTLATQNTPTGIIGLKLGRTENAIYAKASKENISLRPTNQSPYNRKSKKS